MSEKSDDIILSISADVAAMRRAQKKMETFIGSFSNTAEKQLGKVSKSADKSFKDIENSARRMRKQLDSTFSKPFAGLAKPLAGIGAALGVNELRKMTDTWTDLNSRVALAAGGLQQGTEVMGRLGDMARRTYSDLEQTTEGYLANSTALKELGYNTDQALDYTESLNNALVVSGAKGQRAATVTDALAKAMALGRLQGVNLNTVISQGGRVAEALAAGLDTTVGGLRKLGAQGKITGNDLVKALSSQMEVLRQEAADMPATIGDGFVLLNNALLQYVGNADTATGVSAKISEALVIIADNFDKVADAGLQVAGVIAGALVGRSLAGMIKSLGLAGSALISFMGSLRAASSMGGLATAFGGLGAAAGPVGMIIGGAVVGALGHYSVASVEASKRTDEVTTRLQKMGLLAKEVAGSIEDASDSVDNLSGIEKIRALREINAELDRMRNGGGTFFSQGDEFDSIRAQAAKVNGLFGRLLDGSTSEQRKINNFALEQINLIAKAAKDGDIVAKDALATLSLIEQTDVTKPVLNLVRQLQQSIKYFHAAELAAADLGDTTEIDKLTAQIVKARDEIQTVATIQMVSDEQKKQIDDLIKKFEDGQAEAKETTDALQAIAIKEPNIAPYLVGVQKLINALGLARDKARELAKEASAALNGTFEDGRETRATADPYIINRQAGDAYEKEALRRAALGKSQLTLENEIAKVRNDALKEGITLTEQQIANIAKANIAGNDSRTAEGKKPKRERDNDYERLTQQINDRTAAMVAETEVQRQLNPLIDDYGYAVEKARAEQELLNAAQKAGVTITPELRAEIAATAEQFAQATVEAGQLAEAQDKIRQNAQEMAAFQQDLTRSMVDGFIQGKNAAEIFADALTKIGNKLLDLAFNGLFDFLGGGFGGGQGAIARGGGIGLYAEGGEVTGPGSGTSDSILARLSNGEFVVNAKAAAQHRGLLEAINAGSLPGFKAGGSVGVPSIRTPTVPSLPSASAINSRQGSSDTINTPVNINIDATGADAAGLARVQAELQRLKSEIPGRVVSSLRDANKRGVKFN